MYVIPTFSFRSLFIHKRHRFVLYVFYIKKDNPRDNSPPKYGDNKIFMYIISSNHDFLSDRFVNNSLFLSR